MKMLNLLLLIFCTLFSLGQSTQVNILADGAYDGTVSAGGTVVSDSVNLIIGDDAADDALAAILSFDTSALPDDAFIIGAKLLLFPSTSSGDTSAAGLILVDQRTGFFGPTQALEPEDFSAPADLTRAFALHSGNPTMALFNARSRAAINLTGLTQFRLRFSEISQNLTADQLLFFSGDAPSGRPELVLSYTTLEEPQVPVVISLNPIGPSFATAAQTLSGSVTPPDAMVMLKGNYLDVDSNGDFSLPVTLHSGVNTFLLEALAYNYLDSTTKLDLYLDTEGPVINITAPLQQTRTNKASIDVQGILEDRFDGNPTLSRDGQNIRLNGNRFSDESLPLVQGENVFTYLAVDTIGNSSQKMLTVFHNSVPPLVSLNIPQHIAAGADWTLSLSLTPAEDVDKVYVTIDNQQVYEASDGTPFVQTFTHDGKDAEVNIQVTARDIYGNITQIEKTIQAAFQSFIQGRVLDNRTSLPLAGLSVRARTDFAPDTLLTTDENGRYSGYISGLPLNIEVQHPGFLPAIRRVSDYQLTRRIPDLRLTPTAGTATGPQLFPGFTAELSSGSASITAIGNNSLPALLPLGYSPLMGVSLQNANGSGSLTLSETNLLRPVSGTLVLLRRQDHGWLVDSLGELTSAPLQILVNNALNGDYLVALPDSWGSVVVPAIGDFLQRQKDQVALTSLKSIVSPRRVSVIETPQTSFYYELPVGELPSGTRARVRVSEFHDRFSGELYLEDDFLDLYCYSLTQNNRDRLLGQIEVHTRAEVDVDLTRRASLQFQPIIEELLTPLLYPDGRASLGRLRFDFSASSPQNPAVHLNTTLADDLSSSRSSSLILAFDLWLGHQLEQAPALILDEGPHQNLVLLHRQDKGVWVYAGQLSFDGAHWTNHPQTMDLTQSGLYALVAIDEPITMVSGSVSAQAGPRAGVLVNGPNHPWYGQSAINGNYSFFVLQDTDPLILKAFSPTDRLEANRTLPISSGQLLLDNQDFTLTSPDFRMLAHEPESGAQYISRLPRIYLNFTMPLTLDLANLSANIRLSDPSNNSVPLQILQDRQNNALEILPGQTLIQDTTYSLALLSGLENLYGQTLRQAESFDFHTQMESMSGTLDMSRFYLTWDSAQNQLYLEAPADTYPLRTWINVLNERTAASDSWLMAGGAYKQAVTGEPGDRFDLEATAPDGTRVRHNLDVIKTGENTWQLGSSPFSFVFEGKQIRVDEIQSGFGRELGLESITLEDMNLLATDLDVLKDGNLTAHEGLRFVATDGQALPQIKGRIAVEIPVSDQERTFVSLLIQENIPFPVEPGGVEMIPTDLVFPMDQMRVKNGAPLSKRSKIAGFYSMAFDTGNTINRPGSLKSGGFQSAGSAVIFSSSDVPQNYRIRSYRDPSPRIPLPLTPKPNWPDLPGVVHVPYTTVHLQYGNSWRPLGFTDKSGNGKFIDYGGRSSGRATDPITGLVTSGFASAPSQVTDYFGEIVHSLIKLDMHFQIDSAQLQEPLPQISLTWDVIDSENAVVTPATQELREFGRILSSSLYRLRANIRRKDGPLADVLLTIDGIETGDIKRTSTNSVQAVLPNSWLSAAGLLDILITAPKEGDYRANLKAVIRVLDNQDPTVGTLPGPPAVIYCYPSKGVEEVSLSETVRIDFSEPVKNLKQGISLSNANGKQIAFSPVGANELVLADGDFATTVFLELEETLSFGQNYILRVDDVFDQDNERLKEAYETTFKTLFLKNEQYLGDHVDFDYDGRRLHNLFITAETKINATSVNFHLYDLKFPNKPELLWSFLELGKPAWLRTRLLVFTPDELLNDEDSFIPDPDPEELLEELEAGTHFVLVGLTPSGATQIAFYEYDGDSVNWLDTFDLLGGGIPRIEKIGGFIAISFSDLLTQKEGTAVYRIKDFLDKRVELSALRKQRYTSYRTELLTLAKVSWMSQPSTSLGVDTLWRTGQDGFNKPTLLLAGKEYPGIFDFDPNQFPTMIPMAISPELDHLDSRVLARTSWGIGSNIKRRATSLTRFPYKITEDGVLTSQVDDLAIFSNGVREIRIFKIPETDRDLNTLLEPMITLVSDRDIWNIAADQHSGLLAIHHKDKSVNFLDLKPLLAASAVGDSVALEGDHNWFLLDEPLSFSFLREIYFEYGCLYGPVSKSGSPMVHLPVDPVIFRTYGFQYYDLNKWGSLNKKKDSPVRLRHSAEMVFYATDKRVDGVDKFVMEMGTYDITTFPEEKAKLTLSEFEGDTLDELERDESQYYRIHNFSMYPLVEKWFQNTDHQKELREKGYKAFTIEAWTEKNGVKRWERETNFIVAYLPPDSKFTDPFTSMEGVDSLSLMPDILTLDHSLTSIDARLNLSPGRAYHHLSAFQSGPYGVGMLNSQALYLALPTWWDLEKIDGQWHDASGAQPQLLLEHPGNFRLWGEIDETRPETEVTITNDLVSTLELGGDDSSSDLNAPEAWQLRQNNTMVYNFTSRSAMPTYKKLFENTNRAIKDEQNAHEQMSYPVYRYSMGSGVPPRLMGEVAEGTRIDKPWQNKLQFLNVSGNSRTPSRRPEIVREIVADGGSRNNLVSYTRSKAGVVVRKVDVDSDGIALEFDYDEDGYLKTLTRGDRKLYYLWEDLGGLKLGKFIPKRLKSITLGDLTTTYGYQQTDDIRIKEIQTPLGVKSLTVVANDLGQVQELTIPGIQTPTQKLFFKNINGLLLCEKFALGSREYALTWTELTGQKKSEWRIGKNDLNKQVMTYDALGRLTSRTTHETVKSTWEYDNDAQGPFWSQPTVFTDPVGNVFSISTNEHSISTTSSEGVTQVVKFSHSGVPSHQKDINGIVSGTTSTRFYGPNGDGFTSSNGRITRLPVQGTQQAQAEYEYNKYGEIVREVVMGIETTYEDFDQLGRAGRITTGDVKTLMNYSSGSNLIQTAIESGNSSSQEFNELGQLVKEVTSVESETTTLDYQYDYLGRLTRIVDPSQPTPVYEATYPGDLTTPTLEISQDQTMQYSVNLDGSISGMTRIIPNVPAEQIPLETNLLGQVIKTQAPGQGLMDIKYDAFGRIIEMSSGLQGQSDLGSEQYSWTYGDRTVQMKRKNAGVTVTTTQKDMAGLSRTVSVAEDGATQGISREFNTEIGPGNPVSGYSFTTREAGGDIAKYVSIDARGNLLEQQFGKYGLKAAGTPDRFGQPTQYSGMVQMQMQFDNLGRPEVMTDEHGHQHMLEYDRYSRVASYVNSLAQKSEFHYQQSSNALTLVETDGPNVLGTDKVPVLQKDNLAEGTFTNWLGKSVKNEVIQPGRTEKIVKTDNSVSATKSKRAIPAYEAIIHSEPTVGKVTSIENFSGETTTYDYGMGDRKVSISPPGTASQSVETDVLGQVQKVTRGGITSLTIERDNEQRPRRVQGEDRTYHFAYQEEDLSTITGGRHPLFFDNYNGLGKPEQVRIGEVATIDVSYYQGGIPACITSRKKGGTATVLNYDSFGHLSQIRRGFQKPVAYTYNQWGAPATVQVGNGPSTNLFSGQSLTTLNLPGGVTAEVDYEGRMSQVQIPGLAPKDLVYDGQGRLAQVFIDDQLQETYLYEDGHLKQAVTGNGVNQNIIDYVYDKRGRFKQATSVLDGTSSQTYFLDENEISTDQQGGDRLKTYTDPNGATYTYAYDETGRVKQIELSDGPTFVYERDEAGNLLSVSIDDMAAKFQGYSNGLPATMIWQGPGISESFTITQTAEGRLARIESDHFLLDLDWNEGSADGCDAPEASDPRLQRVTRQGPDFKEVWEPVYNLEDQLESLIITRQSGNVSDPDCAGCSTQVIEESYGSINNQLMGQFTRIVDGVTVLGSTTTLDGGADNRRILLQDSSPGQTSLLYDTLGNLIQQTYANGYRYDMSWDGTRRLRQLTLQRNLAQSETYSYDLKHRRISRKGAGGYGELVYAYEGSAVIAIGRKEPNGHITWTHAYGRGPLGVAFVKDLSGTGKDAFIFADHLGTPFAYYDTRTQQTSYTPYNPWGELLATSETPKPLYKTEGEVPTWQFKKAEDPIFPSPPLGLNGHLYDHHTGLVYMHNRYYHPRLGHFLTADFRAPDIYDPSTVTEPYAYAAGNPIMFWDPDGLKIMQGKLAAEDEPTFIAALSKVTGFTKGNIVFEKGFLKVKDPMSFTGGSEFARQKLLEWIDNPLQVGLYSASNDQERNQLGKAEWGERMINNDYRDIIFIDFKDFGPGVDKVELLKPGINEKSKKELSDLLLESNQLGLTIMHEFFHAFDNLGDPGKYKRRGKTLRDIPGPRGEVVEQVNVIRRELGLLERLEYMVSPIHTIKMGGKEILNPEYGIYKIPFGKSEEGDILGNIQVNISDVAPDMVIKKF